MYYSKYIKSIIFVLSILIGISMCMFTTVMADQHAEEASEAEEAETTTDEAEASEEASEADAPVRLESLVVVGSRSQPRSVLDSAVPIDIVSNESFEKQGGADLPDLLRTLVPSYNINTQPISDASTVVRPANLRGLAPDHTLVLVNNKRRHRAAVIHWLGNGLSDGSQGPDLAPIPAIALRQVEILRDGASAQYGSDAIAGVMNFQLKDNHEGGSFEFKPGIYQYGDGRQFAVAGNIGLGNPDAWSSLSFEYGGADPTIRSVQRNDAIALINAGNFSVKDPAQIWGQPIIENDIKLFANYGATLTDTIDFYGHANYARKRVEGGFYFRNPNTRGGVFSTTGGETLLVGDLRGLTTEMADWETRKAAAEAAGQEFTELSPHDADDIPITNHVPDPERLQAVRSDPNLFTFQEMFPGGFTPRFGAFMWDSSVV
ncbi:TonB-dependent receptor plug domain-containing protein, partial [Candidatus Poribacteria bacterium]|nr:TonB-dependent receptor plug domain-containing protein [Candidatus Poribacteria bacterium]